jgi:hypothetical protein
MFLLFCTVNTYADPGNNDNTSNYKPGTIFFIGLHPDDTFLTIEGHFSLILSL